MGSTVQYLETYVENTTYLPSELQRTLELIRRLDERVATLYDYCRDQSDGLSKLPAAGARTPEQQQEFEVHEQGLNNARVMIYQFIEERVQLAQRCVDLINVHQTELDTTLELLEKDLAEQQAAQPEAYNPFETAYPATQGKRGGRHQFDQWDTLDPLGTQPMKRATSHVAANKGKRPKDEGLGGSYDDGVVGMDYAAPVYREAMASPLQFRNHAAVAGLMDKASQPQLPGRLLTAADIRPELKGRQAEMFWPDDGMWYLIEIHKVNAAEKSATIVYRTGEVEDLDLQEIANEAHMSLIDI